MITKHPNIDRIPFTVYFEVDGGRHMETVSLEEMNRLVVSGELPKRILEKAAAIKARNRAGLAEEVVGEEAE